MLKNDLQTATMTVTEVAKNHHPQLDLEEISMTQPSLSVSDEDEDIQLNNNREEDEDDDEDLSYLNPMEREFIQIMRYFLHCTCSFIVSNFPCPCPDPRESSTF